VNEKKDRVTDALNATKAAVEEGIVPGMLVRHSFRVFRLISKLLSVTSTSLAFLKYDLGLLYLIFLRVLGELPLLIYMPNSSF